MFILAAFLIVGVLGVVVVPFVVGLLALMADPTFKESIKQGKNEARTVFQSIEDMADKKSMELLKRKGYLKEVEVTRVQGRKTYKEKVTVRISADGNSTVSNVSVSEDSSVRINATGGSSVSGIKTGNLPMIDNKKEVYQQKVRVAADALVKEVEETIDQKDLEAELDRRFKELAEKEESLKRGR